MHQFILSEIDLEVHLAETKRKIEFQTDVLILLMHYSTARIAGVEVPLTEDEGQMRPPLIMEEMSCAINRLKNHKSPNSDGITAV